MNLVFHCQSCGSRFDVDPRLAGKPGRCKRCGQRTIIPMPADLASMRGMPPIPKAARATGHAKARHPAPAVAAPPSWIAAIKTDVGLVPLTLDERTPAADAAAQARARAKYEDDDSGPALYGLAGPAMPAGPAARSTPAAGPVMIFWRTGLRGIQKPLRWLNDAAYLVSVPFLIAILLGVILRNRPMANLGAAVAVLLNVGRLATGLANLVIIPFKEGILQGVSFLIPPLTFVYLANHWKGMKKPARRVLEPAVTIGLVVLAFSFIPWLARKGGGPATVGERISAGAGDLEQEIRAEVAGARGVDLGKVEAQAEGTLKGLGLDGPGAPAGDGPSKPPAAPARGADDDRNRP